jgi:hypothetical protein
MLTPVGAVKATFQACIGTAGLTAGFGCLCAPRFAAEPFTVFAALSFADTFPDAFAGTFTALRFSFSTSCVTAMRAAPMSFSFSCLIMVTPNAFARSRA